MRPGSKAIIGLAILAASLAAAMLVKLPNTAHTFSSWSPTLEADRGQATMRLSDGDVLDIVIDDTGNDQGLIRLRVVFQSTGVIQARPVVDWRIIDMTGTEVGYVTHRETVVPSGTVEEIVVDWERAGQLEGIYTSLVQISLGREMIEQRELQFEAQGLDVVVEPSVASEPESTVPTSTETSRDLDSTNITETPASTPQPTETPVSEATFTPTVTTTETPTVEPTGTSTESIAGTATAEATAVPDLTATVTEAAVPKIDADQPRIALAWTLPDMQPGMPGMQYHAEGSPERHDDDMFSPGIQVVPNLGDTPEARRIEHWFVVEAPGGVSSIADAVVSVIAPDGAFKQNLHASATDCAGLGWPSEAGSVLAAAVATGQIGLPAAERVAACDEAGQVVFTAVGGLSVLDPVGIYEIETAIVDQAGTAIGMTIPLENLPVLGLQIDAAEIDFGEISPGLWQQTDSVRSVRNIGNVSGHINLRFSPMLGSSTGEVIDEFGATLDSEQIMSIAAGTTVCFAEVVEPNETHSIRLLVHPGALPPDRYMGKLSFNISAHCPT